MKLYCKECQQMKCSIGESICTDCQDEVMRCTYCESISTKKYAFKTSVWVNGGKREFWFCDNARASYYQMGAEG